IEEIDIEADMQVRIAVEAGERLLHRIAHAHLIDVAHVEHIESLLMDEALLARVDAANADLAHARRIDGRSPAADLHQLARPEAAQARHRHAMHTAAPGPLTGLEV